MDAAAALTASEFRLIEEALRRLTRSRVEASWTRDQMVAALVRALKGGRRDLFSLVRAARGSLEQAGI